VKDTPANRNHHCKSTTCIKTYSVISEGKKNETKTTIE
jgi:hypothetical protein